MVMDAPVGMVDLVGQDEQYLVGLVGLGEPWCSSRRAPPCPGLALSIMQAGEPRFVENVAHEPDLADQAGHAGVSFVAFAGIPLRDAEGQVLGILGVIDHRPRRWRATERRALEALGAAVVSALRLYRDVDRRQRLLEAFDAAPAAIAVIGGAEHVLEYANPAFCESFGDLALGLSAAGTTGNSAGGWPSQLSEAALRVWATGETIRAKGVAVGTPSTRGEKSGERFFDVSYSIIGRLASGDASAGAGQDRRAILVVAVDVTEAVLARHHLQRYARHQRFLVRAAAALNSELDPLAQLAQLADVVVPELADLATVHLLVHPVPPFRRPPLPVVTDRVAVVAIPELGELPDLSSGLVWEGDGDPITETIRHGRLLRQPYRTPTPPSWSLATGSAGTIRAGLRHIVLAPVIVDGLVVAVVSFGMCGDRAPWREDELSVLAEVARYAGAALGHGMSYQQIRESALVLQRSLLGELPSIAGLELCARYRPAGHDEVGGDWYDAFALVAGLGGVAEAADGGQGPGARGREAVAAIGRERDGRATGLALVVGDVVGHDISAAAAMGQLRASLRTLALDPRAGPADIVNRLERFNSHFAITEFATLVHAHLRPLAEGCWSMRWAVAGHLPPLLVTAAGGSLLEGATGGPLMWMGASKRAEAQVVLLPGSTVLLYTDGLVEHRGADLADCLSTLAGQAAGLAGLPLEQVCDEVIRSAPTEDDAAVLIVRVDLIRPGAGDPARPRASRQPARATS